MWPNTKRNTEIPKLSPRGKPAGGVKSVDFYCLQLTVLLGFIVCERCRIAHGSPGLLIGESNISITTEVYISFFIDRHTHLLNYTLQRIFFIRDPLTIKTKTLADIPFFVISALPKPSTTSQRPSNNKQIMSRSSARFTVTPSNQTTLFCSALTHFAAC